MRYRVSVLLGLAACGNPSSPAIDATSIDDLFDRQAMLEHFVEHIFVPNHEAVVAPTQALADAIDASCTTDLPAARAAWVAAIDAWERTEGVLVGPAAMDEQALRYRIYAWPLLATCGVDREVIVHWADPGAYDVTAELSNVRSLSAIEYLLFNESTGHTCAAEPEGWTALGADLPAARCALAAKLADDVAVAAQLAADGWDTYAAELPAIEPLREGVNTVSDALYYVDRMVKDMKVGEAAGITINACGTVQELCAREAEHRFSDHGIQAIRQNLVTLREVFTGTTAAEDGPGFDDYLRAVGATTLADRMTASIDAAIAAAEAMPDSLLTTIVDDHATVVALHEALRAITSDLKAEFATSLGLDIPDDIATDTD